MAAPQGIVGRERERAELSRLLGDVLQGVTRLALIAGEPGIGKTTLADVVAEEARTAGARVVWGRAVETGGAPPFWPWVQVIRGVLDPDAEVAPAVRRLVPELRDEELHDVDPSGTDSARFELFDGVARELVRAARAEPLVVVLDDLHAADVASIQLLHFCSREIRDASLLLVATYRDAEVRADAELSELIGRISREGRSIAVHGLSADDVAGVLRSEFGVNDDRVGVTVHELTDGNPLFVREIGRLFADGRLDLERVGASLPEGVRETIRQRVRPLPGEVRDVVDAAAVAGTGFWAVTLASAVGRPEADVLAALDAAERFGLVRRDGPVGGQFRFSHALIREALYEDLSSTSRSAMHGRLAEAIEHGHAGHIETHLAELAHHYFEASTAGSISKAIGYSRRAGRQALRLYAYEEAVNHLERALLFESDATQRCELLLDLSEAWWKSGNQEHARAAFADAATIARSSGDATLLARAALGFGGGGYTGRVDPLLHDLLTEALAVTPDACALRARLLSRLALELYYEDRERNLELTAEAVDIARTLDDDPATLIYALNARRNAVWGPDDLEGRIAMATEVAQIGARFGLREHALDGHIWRMYGLAEAGDVEGMDRELELLDRLTAELRQPQTTWEIDVFKAARLITAGRLADAERSMAEAASRGSESHVADAGLAHAVQLFCLRELQGRLHEIEGALDGFAVAYPHITALRAAAIFALAELGRTREAQQMLDAFRADGFTLRRDRHWLIGAALLAQASARLQDEASAGVVYEMLAPYADHIVVTPAVLSFGSIAHHLGILADALGRPDDAVRHLEHALERHVATRNRPWQARTSYELGRVHAANGDDGRAKVLLRAALETSGELGMTGLLARAREAYARVAEATLAEPEYTEGPHGETAILFTDLVRSTHMLERIGDIRAHEVLTDHHRIVRKRLIEFGGEETRFQGDGFMAVFEDPRSAISCAVAIQTSIAAYTREHPDTVLHVRTGIHFGVPLIEDGELHGRSVVVASRIADAAAGGEILVSSRVRDLVTDDVLYGPPRETELKGFDGPYTLYPVLWG